MKMPIRRLLGAFLRHLIPARFRAPGYLPAKFVCLLVLGAAPLFAGDTPATIPAPAAGSATEKQINDLRDQLALIQAQTIIANAKTALDTATGTKSADQKLSDTIDAIKKFGDAMPKGTWTVQTSTTSSPEAIYQNFAGLRVAALRFAAMIRRRDGATIDGKPLVLVPFGQEAVATNHLLDFEAQYKQIKDQWTKFNAEIDKYQKIDSFWDPDSTTHQYYVQLIGPALEVSKPASGAPSINVLPALIAAAPEIVNAVAGLFKSDTTESVGTSGLTDEGLQCAIVEGLVMEDDSLKSYVSKLPASADVSKKPGSVYVDRDVYLQSTAAAEAKKIEADVNDIALYTYGAVRVKSYVDAALAPQSKDFDTRVSDLADARKALADAQAAEKKYSVVPDDEKDADKTKRTASLKDARDTIAAKSAAIAESQPKVVKLARSVTQLKSLSDRLNDFATTATKFLGTLATKQGDVPLPVLLVRESRVRGNTNPFFQLSAKIIAQGVSTITTKYVFWTTRKSDEAIAVEYRLTDANGRLYDAGVYAENTYTRMGDQRHANTERR